MRAITIQDGELRVIADAPEPVPGPDAALIRPLLGGICNTDLELVRGYYGYQGILGHEFVGEVITGPEDWPGKRVVGEINIGCGQCDFCLAGVPSHCRARTTLGINGHPGCFADLMTLPVCNLHVVPSAVTDEQVVFTEPLAAALQTLEMAHIRPSDRVIVLGAGKLGMLIAQVVRLTGADLAVVVRHQKQADLLARWGIQIAGFEELPAAQADVVVDATGRAAGFADAQHLLRPRGTLVLKSTYHGLPEANLTAIAVEEVSVVGSRCGPFAAALRLLEAGLVDVDSLIEGRYPLVAGVDAFAAAAQPGRLKVLLTFAT
ncbi:MAG: alcohol dehydrogenase catalytic domain-containing protein [Anaerolineae bacterium]|nr:alcohol dehydrogenase catalytic domain-containing protein [Anaerolineae bacterium]